MAGKTCRATTGGAFGKNCKYWATDFSIEACSDECHLASGGLHVWSDVTEVSERSSTEEIDMKEINEAFEVHGNSADHQTDRFSYNDEDQFDIDDDELDDSYDSETENELEFIGVVTMATH
ncbi:hypothetical protein Pyn_07087 [Prunus yedoensis var. nudiflora]|uniref:Uncharacterized protein n=1 Tax=Prunus yedoensis var. nudiflora TaxID=2094558 RepID=A0A314XZ06_PRUYE|nr:hypothetical protein Pyn_22870 [Prunus yedoensis var. nudiflora]PQQ19315.1 hypothetical protein Pyn_07087 [Prunus yedoensis var. nudiflora]